MVAPLDGEDPHWSLPAASRIAAGLERLTVCARDAGWSRAQASHDALWELLGPQLRRPLGHLFARTWALELGIARLDGLDGGTPQARYRSFVGAVRTHPERVLDPYPLLVWRMERAIERWETCGAEFLARFSADRGHLARALGGGVDPGLPVQTDPAGDAHAGGRTVLRVRFASGLRLVYKPKSLAADVHLQDLLVTLNRWGAEPSFPVMDVSDRGAYGWEPLARAEPCATSGELARYYRRMGGYVTVLHALAAADIHRENVVAARDSPLIVDRECLFHPYLRERETESWKAQASAALTDSVLRMGLLPHRLGESRTSAGLDVSGLGSSDGLTPSAVPTWSGAGTDELRLVRERRRVTPASNVPWRDGPPRVADLHRWLTSGFDSTYRLLLARQDDLLDPEGPLAPFAGDDVRVILRPTRAYAALAREATHPDLLHSEAAARLFLRQGLERAHERRPHLAAVSDIEVDELLAGDVPRFTTRPGSPDVMAGTGRAVPGLLREEWLTPVDRGVRRLCEEDRERQTWFIAHSLAALTSAGGAHTVTPPRGRPRRATAALPPAPELLRAARAAGDAVAHAALRAPGAAAWLGPALRGGDRWRLQPLGLDLYDGAPGICLFLAALAVACNDERYGRLARDGLAPVRRRLRLAEEQEASPGAFDGLGGVVYAFAHLGSVWEDDALLGEAETLTVALEAHVAQAGLDVAAGVAGAALGLLALHAVTGSTRALAVAISCGERVAAQWPAATPEAPVAPAGMGWGPHGAGAVLCELGERSGRPDLTATGAELLARPGPSGTDPAWCTGATGIVAARLRANSAELGDVDRLTDLTEAQLPGEDSLCHGGSGILATLHAAVSTGRAPELRPARDRLAASLVARGHGGDWRCGVPLGTTTPSLFTGIAGIGATLLALSGTHLPWLATLSSPPER